jgi:aminoglycoside phosphotransferase (APT) family kinase protein
MSNETLLDKAQQVREGEALDVDAVDAWLKKQVPALEGRPTVTQFPGGASNLTYQLDYPDRSLILRRPPFGTKAKGAHDMGREYKVMSRLKPVYPQVPEMVAFCDDDAVLGCEFYVMEKLRGIILRTDMPAGLNLDETGVRELCTRVVDQLIALHKVDYKQAGLEDLGKGSGYVERQITGWSKRFRDARTDNVSDCEQVMAWLHDHMPEDVASVVIHNDFRFDNVVLDPDDPMKVIGVLDWEMATLGDPLMDLGNTLAYWVQDDDDPFFQMTRRQPTNVQGMMTRQEVIDYYCEQTGWRAENFDFYLIYGLFRLAVILQQIYYRYHHGQTQDKRFAQFWQMVNYLDQRCLQLIERSKL